jgi:hypothetical protein
MTGYRNHAKAFFEREDGWFGTRFNMILRKSLEALLVFPKGEQRIAQALRPGKTYGKKIALKAPPARAFLFSAQIAQPGKAVASEWLPYYLRR